MGKLRFGKMLDRLCLSSSYGTSCCICINGYGSSFDGVDDLEKEPLVGTEGGELVRLKDFVEEPKSLALQLKPKVILPFIHFLIVNRFTLFMCVCVILSCSETCGGSPYFASLLNFLSVI